MREQVSFIQFMTSVIEELKSEERFSTAKVYAAALRSVKAYAGGGDIYFGALSPGWLRRFEDYLRKQQRQWNTISTYMRMLRATYNRAVVKGLAQYERFLFRKVYTGVMRDRKQALAAKEMRRLIYAAPRRPLSADEAESREWLKAMFELQGMPFVDFAHLKQSDLNTEKCLLTCRRQKTGTSLEISLTASMMKWIEQHRNPESSASPYLFNILDGELEGVAADADYQRCLRRLNRNLEKVAEVQKVSAVVSSYTARHTWATLAKHCGIPTSLISDALGHKSVKTTEIYLKSFENNSIGAANNKVIATVKRADTA